MITTAWCFRVRVVSTVRGKTQDHVRPRHTYVSASRTTIKRRCVCQHITWSPMKSYKTAVATYALSDSDRPQVLRVEEYGARVVGRATNTPLR